MRKLRLTLFIAFGLSALVIALMAPMSYAMTTDVQMVQPRAYFVETGDGLYKPLDLKLKTLRFSKRDFEACGHRLVRKEGTLTYTCRFALPTHAKQTRLRHQLTPEKLNVKYAGKQQPVQVTIANDGRSVRYQTSFDTTGLDLDVAQFNDDFYRNYAKAAEQSIAEAMSRSLKYQILEARR